MTRIEFISPDDFQKIWKAEKRREMKLFLMLAFGAGMRISEIVGLPLKVSSCCRTQVARRLEKIGNRKYKRYYCSECEKALEFSDLRYSGNQWEISPLTADKVDLARHQIRIDNAKGGKWRITITPPSLTEEYRSMLPLKLSRRTIQHRFSAMTKKVLGKRMSPHILRHGFGNYQANVLKTPLPQVQQLLGHSRLDTTGIYTKANPEDSINSVWKAMNQE